MKRRTPKISPEAMVEGMIGTGIASLSHEEVLKVAFAMPWAPQQVVKDEDGFRVSMAGGDFSIDSTILVQLQAACWEKFLTNPHVSSSVRDTAGAVAGLGFDMSSAIPEIAEVLTEVMDDPRNGVRRNAKKWVSRAEIDGELFILLTLHDTGFVEIDFIDPKTVGGNGVNGVMVHPEKPTFPLGYTIQRMRANSSPYTIQIPSINIAYYPDQVSMLKQNIGWNDELAKDSKDSRSKYKKVGGFKRFIVAWDRALFTTRNIGHLRSTLEWINLYENLKKYEIDHKKSSGSYLWVAEMEDARAYQLWMSMTAEQKAETGLMRSKSPGSTIILPPGIKLAVQNPSLPKISDQDTDILQMITSGLNKPEDVITGSSKGTFASVKASRGPQSDRIDNDKEDFRQFIKYDLLRAVFFLRNAANPGFKLTYKVNEAVAFKDKEPVFKDVDKPAIELVDISMPSTALSDAEAISRALLGVKHGSLADTLGIPLEELAKRLGFANYRTLRLQYATEKDTLPDVQTTIDAETAQEMAMAKADGSQQNASGGKPKEGSESKPAAKKPLPKPKGGK